MRLPVIDHLGSSLIAQEVRKFPLITFIEGESMKSSQGAERSVSREQVSTKGTKSVGVI